MYAIFVPLTYKKGKIKMENIDTTVDCEVLADLLDLPAVSAHVVSDDSIENGETQAAPGFDPAIHATGPDGKPSLTRAGKFRAKSRKKSASVSVLPHNAKSVPPSTDQCRVAGVAAAHALLSVSQALGGAEWSPADGEAKMLEVAFGDYFVASGMSDFPPGIALTFVVGAYALPRLSMPTTSGKIKNALTKIVGWVRG